ncbi:MAG: SDR family NAD(P)-dependent oxidoreductase [Oceanospirillaceae bacterium]|nr:SDR family NAD(P)-dependent oxidoreductase [Oceanospirillaceae bacterium]MBT5797994.1 SDR family NAD(P)-dependent oxidoreductase [Porticoccaceae bacterium]
MKRILITGASSGIGKHLTYLYLSMGWHVIACGRLLSKLQAAVPSAHPALTLCTFDINQRTEVITKLKQIEALDLVILNAGTCEYMDDPLPFDSELFKRVIETNVIGTGYCLEGVLGNVKQGGQLAIVSSSVTLLPLTRSEAYGASKAALDYLTRTLAIDLSPKNIAVSLIRPGFVDTALTQKNTFSMPGLISAEKACRYIMHGLEEQKLEINFPRKFFFTMKILALLPNTLWRRLAIKMIRGAE